MTPAEKKHVATVLAKRRASARKGWATREAKRREGLVVVPAITLEIVQGPGGLCVYLNGHRIAGEKPLGGGLTLEHWFIKDEDLEKAIKSRGRTV